MGPLRLGFFCVIVILIFTACSDRADEPPIEATIQRVGPQPTTAAVSANNHGVGLMSKYKYEAARKIFAELAEDYPDWLDVKVNLAIATLNRQQEGDEQAALAIVDQVLKADPDHLRAHYVAGLLRLYLVSPREALSHFERVTQGDPGDAYAAYYLAQCLAQLGDYQQALQWYRQAMRLEPYLRSAYYGAFQTLQRLRRTDEARELVADYQWLANNPRALLAEFIYTRMGPKGNALAVDQGSPKQIPPPEGPDFEEAIPLPMTAKIPPIKFAQVQQRPPSITTVDLQNDGRQDLFIPSVLNTKGVFNLVLLGLPDNTFTPDLTHPLAKVPQVNAALWGDFDNDGLTDVYLLRQGPNQLWRQHSPGQWQDVTESTKTSGGHSNTVDGAFFDADHDGDLDLFLVNGDAPNELLNNNLNGTFRPLAAKYGLASSAQNSRTVVPVDIDHDRDVDLIVINRNAPNEVYINDRLWSYHSAAGFDQFRSTPALTAIAGDLDSDGRIELYSMTPQGALYEWEPDKDGVFKPAKIEQFDEV